MTSTCLKGIQLDNLHFTLASSAETSRPQNSLARTLCFVGRSILRCVALIAVVNATACQSAQPDRLDGAISSYESKNWKQSLEQASVVQNETSA